MSAASARLGHRSASEPKEAFFSGTSHASRLRDWDRKPVLVCWSLVSKSDFGKNIRSSSTVADTFVYSDAPPVTVTTCLQLQFWSEMTAVTV